MSRITASPYVDRLPDDERPRFTAIILQQIVDALNNGLDFGTNFNARTLSITFSAAGTDTALAHGLGRPPVGYIVVGRDGAFTVYNGATASTPNLIYLRASSTGTASVLVF